MKMRDYVDGIQGPGSWDTMHDLIDKQQILGWDLPPIMVDNHLVHVFPGTDREVTLEAVQNEVRKALAEIARGEAEEVEPSSLN
jgi:hypothetical protein